MRAVKLCLFIVTIFCMFSCRYYHTEPNEHWDLTRQQRDSMAFSITHHYSLNYNFSIISDSLRLCSELPQPYIHNGDIHVTPIRTDTFTLHRDDKIVVADIVPVKTDSTSDYWIKVAHDQETMGWISETELLKSVVPCDPISRFIHAFNNRHILAFIAILGFGAATYIYRRIHRRRIYLVHLNDIHSIYPTLFCLFTATAATLYGCLQKFVPETWAEFYFYPTLNPFGQPFILSIFLTCVWLMLITAHAAIDDVRKQLHREEAVSYLFGLACTSLVLYLFFSLTIRIYIGLLCFPAYAIFAILMYLRHNTNPYYCGQCGQPLKHLGRCPHCGTINE